MASADPDQEDDARWDLAAAAAVATAGLTDQLDKLTKRRSVEPDTAPSFDGDDLAAAAASSSSDGSMVGRAQRTWLLPRDAQTRASLEVPLRSSDCLYLRAPLVPNAFVINSELAVAPLQAGLQEAIDIFPVAAGRVRRFTLTSATDRPVRIVLKRSRGVPLTVRRRRGDAPETAANPGLKSWSKFLRWSKDELLETNSSDPLLRVELFLLPEVRKSVLVVTFCHLFGDGAAMVHFMNTWSHLACVAAGTTPVPAEMPPPPVLDRSADYDPRELARTHAAGPGASPEGRLPPLQVVKFVASVLAARTHSRVEDFALDLAEVQRRKEGVMSALAPGEWVSSYEVMMAMLLKAQSLADFGAQGAAAREINTRAIVNTRGRGKLDVPYYVGNALAYVPLDIPATCHAAGDDAWLPKTALFLHDTLRSQISDPQVLDRIHYVYEDGVTRHAAMRTPLHRLAWMKTYSRNVLEEQSICNSWLGYNYFDMTFGGEQRPVLFRVPKSFTQRRMVFIAPRSDSEVLVRVHLSSARAARFEEAVEALGLPMRKLTGDSTAAPGADGEDRKGAQARQQPEQQLSAPEA